MRRGLSRAVCWTCRRDARRRYAPVRQRGSSICPFPLLGPVDGHHAVHYSPGLPTSGVHRRSVRVRRTMVTGRRRQVLLLAITVIGGSRLLWVLKMDFHRQRPEPFFDIPLPASSAVMEDLQKGSPLEPWNSYWPSALPLGQ